MAIKWTQETFEDLAKDYKTWTAFLAKYPQAQTIQARGKIDPWKYFTKGAPKAIEDHIEDLWEASDEMMSNRANWVLFARHLVNRHNNSSIDPKQLDEIVEDNATMLHNDALARIEQKKQNEAKTLARIKAMSNDELVLSLNQFAYLLRSVNPQSLDPYITAAKERNIPFFLLHPIFSTL